MKIWRFVDEGLGNAAHLVISEATGVAALIDPLRDVDRYLDAARAAGATITHVFETHVHADFISGSREIAARTGARLGASAGAGLQFEHQPLHDGDEVIVGHVRFTVLATPGHTPEHVSYLASELVRPEQPPVLFSGGSLLVGSVARTDLLGHEHATSLARELYRSLHAKILRLADNVAVYPTHGAGSFCTATPGAARTTTIGAERQANPLLALPSESAFVAEVIRSMPSYPSYFRFMRLIHQRGPRVLGRVPELAPLAPDEVQARQARGEAVVDLRPVACYVESHIPGSFHVELRPAFAAWVGWVVPFGTPVVLVSESPSQYDEAVRQLVRIGYDDLPGFLAGGMAAWERAGLPVARLPVLSVAELRRDLRRTAPRLVLDVRQAAEWAAGHLPGARHVELGALPSAKLDFARDRPIAVHCGHTQRATTALSVLERRGYTDLALVDGGFEAWQQAGFPVSRDVATPAVSEGKS